MSSSPFTETTTTPASTLLEDLKGKFGWPEYAVFGVVLIVSAGIGVFFGFFSKREQNNEEFLMGGRRMSAWPVALSLVCSFVSAITMLGNPVETYLYGTQYLIIIIAFIPMSFALYYIYVPVYFRLNLTSAYELLEIRFNFPVRLVVSIINCLYLIFYMSLVVYGPSLALNQVTGFDTILSVGIIFVICIFYSSIGGFRAVLWTDALQAVIMIVSIAIVDIKGISDLGFANIWSKLEDSGRVEFFRFDPDHRTRHSVWSVLFGGYFLYLTLFGGTQANIQRYASMPDMKTVKKALIINYVALTITIFLCTVSGLVIYAKYVDCDPIKGNLVEASDQILPLFVMDILGDYPGLPGIFVAGITCASLSSVSSGLNALAAIITEDYVKRIKPDCSTKTLFNMSRAICVISGVLSFAFVFIARGMGDIFPAAISLIGMLLGPTLGIFTLAMVFPWANSWGALAGVIASYIFATVIGLGSAVEQAAGNLPDQAMSLSTRNCTGVVKNSTNPASWDSWKADFEDSSGYIQFVSTSYLFFPLIGALGTLIFGLFFSAVAQLIGINSDPPVRRDCISDCFIWLWTKLFPNEMARLMQPEDYKKPIKTSAPTTNGSLSEKKLSTVSASSPPPPYNPTLEFNDELSAVDRL